MGLRQHVGHRKRWHTFPGLCFERQPVVQEKNVQMTLDLWTFDVGVQAGSPQGYAEECLRRVEESWNGGADMVLFPEFCWMGLESFVEGNKGLRGISDLFWLEMWPVMQKRLNRADKAVVLGTAPFWDETTRGLFNRAPILCEGRALHQDKLHLTPWENAFSPGESLRLWKFGGLTIAVIICLDIEVPELAALLRGMGVDLILVPSATENFLGVERVDRCASARAVELGCCVGVAHLVGQANSDLIDNNVGRTAFYTPSQAAFGAQSRMHEGPVVAHGFQKQRCLVEAKALAQMRSTLGETNPALLTVRPIVIDS
jgi:predicted amidohydrolase